MDENTRRMLQAAAGAAGEKIYVEEVFSTYLYTGNGSTQTITNGIDLSGKGGLVWYKSRNNTVDNALFDTTRGAGNILLSNTTDAQGTGYAQSFTSSGFSLTNGGTFYNGSAYTYASWTFRKAAKFFDVVTYTGNSVAGRTISHNLGSTPGFIITKRTDGTTNWLCYHRSLGFGNATDSDTNYIVLNSTSASNGFGTAGVIVAANATTFTPGASANFSGATYVAYLFAHDAGGFGNSGNDSVVKCGSFSGTGFVDLGWEPQWILIKPYNQTYNLEIYDNMRGMGQPAGASAGKVLRPNTSDAEASASGISFEATGFTQTTFGGSYPCIYIAIRRGPMKTPTDATKVFYPLTRTGTAADTTITGAGFPPDAHLNSVRNVTNNGFNALFLDKLRGPNISLIPLSTDEEISTINTLNSFNQDGVTYGMGSNINSNTKNYINWMFRRAPGFFDVVAYTGTGSVQSISHNLGVTPEMMIIKSRGTGSTNWATYSLLTPTTYRYNILQGDNAGSGGKTYGPGGPPNFEELSAQPTSTVINLASSAESNASGRTFIAYLFASCPGVSKVGGYTGTGTTLQINCGFTAGARFVMIKRTDSTGDWYVWDTARGIISGNDPYLLINSTAAEVTGTDYIDPLSSGFEISSTAPAAINANGGSFIFLAVA